MKSLFEKTCCVLMLKAVGLEVERPAGGFEGVPHRRAKQGRNVELVGQLTGVAHAVEANLDTRDLDICEVIVGQRLAAQIRTLRHRSEQLPRLRPRQSARRTNRNSRPARFR